MSVEDIWGDLDDSDDDERSNDDNAVVARELFEAALRDQPGTVIGLRTLRDGRPGNEVWSDNPGHLHLRALELATKWDVYWGVVARSERSFLKAHCAKANLAWAECDTDDALKALEAFEVRPTFTVKSGGKTASGEDKLHAYWELIEPIEPAELEALLRSIIQALHADPACKDASRVLRVPGTIYHKSDEPAKVEGQHNGKPVDVDDLRHALSKVIRDTIRLAAGDEPPEDDEDLQSLRKSRPKGEGSGRNEWLTKVAGHLVHEADDWSHLQQLIERENRSLDPALSSDELERTVFVSAKRWLDQAQANQRALDAAVAKKAESADQLGPKMALIEKGWRLPAPVKEIYIWGRRPDSRCEVWLTDQTCIYFDSVRDTGSWQALCDILQAQTAGRTVGPIKEKQDKLFKLRALVWQVAQVQELEDEIAETSEWIEGLVDRAAVHEDLTMETVAGRYTIASLLKTSRWHPTGSGELTHVVRDAYTGMLIVRASDLRSFVEEVFRVQLAPIKMTERVRQAGWVHKEIEAWPEGFNQADRRAQPSAKRKVIVYIQEKDRGRGHGGTS
jgi:hypothetical protein